MVAWLFRYKKWLALSVALGGAIVVNHSVAMTLQQQRDLYDQAQGWLDHQQVDRYAKVKKKLSSYPLSPYLDYRALLIELDDMSPKQVRNFIDRHKKFPFSARISAPYIESLAKQHKWAELLQFQQHLPIGEEYLCHYYSAKYHVGQKEVAYQGAQSLWVSASSVSDACDDLFSYWQNAGRLTDAIALERGLLAFEQRSLKVMKYAFQKLKSRQGRRFGHWVEAAYKQPTSVIPHIKQLHAYPHFGDQLLVMTVKQLARLDVKKGYQLAVKIKRALKHAGKNTQPLFRQLDNHIASRLMFESDDHALESLNRWRDNAIKHSGDASLIERRIRLAIYNGNWKSVKDWIELLPTSDKNDSRWGFWLARADIELGKKTLGKKQLKNLLGERSFYSVASATYLGENAEIEEKAAPYHPNKIKPYQTAITRIDEMIKRDKWTAAKREWYWLLGRASNSECVALAQYASEQKWYHLSVIATIKAGIWDNLTLRFPVAYKQHFQFYGKKYNVDPVTLMSLARQESAMDQGARSPVGARGLMQLMPKTARYAAKKYKVDYNHTGELDVPEKNIELGSRYLNELLEYYQGNRVLAFAAYNAGPHRVDQWLSGTSGKMDVYRFIESIPFRETRGYVQNILMFETYYRKLLGLDGDFLHANEISAKY